MSTATLATNPLIDAPAPPARRPRVLLLGAAFGAVAGVLVVAAELAVYLQVRGESAAAGDTTFPEGVVLPLTPGSMGMLTLAMSLVTITWAVYALRNDDRPHAYLAIGLTLLFGVAFINSTVYLYQQLVVYPAMKLAGGSRTLGVLSAIVVTIVFAMGSWYIVEQPFLKLRKRFT